MGILSNIFSKIFHHDSPAAADTAPPPSAAPAASATPVAPVATGASAPAVAVAPPVDVEAVLDGLLQQQAQQLNWRTSIVDLLKLLGLDSSLAARKELAAELHYSGDLNDSATMNLWLHKQVMAKLAANGGKVPAELHT